MGSLSRREADGIAMNTSGAIFYTMFYGSTFSLICAGAIFVDMTTIKIGMILPLVHLCLLFGKKIVDRNNYKVDGFKCEGLTLPLPSDPRWRSTDFPMKEFRSVHHLAFLGPVHVKARIFDNGYGPHISDESPTITVNGRNLPYCHKLDSYARRVWKCRFRALKLAAIASASRELAEFNDRSPEERAKEILECEDRT